MADSQLPPDDDQWREYLARPDDLVKFGRRVFTHIPKSPRCRMCGAPFAGPGAPVMRLIGKRPSDGNPNFCTSCEKNLLRHHGGAEVDGSMLFADIRGSTSIAEKMSPAAFAELIERFYRVASQTVFEYDGMLDKFVGDELVAMFYPAVSGERHAARAVEAARALLRATGHGQPNGPWVPIGAGVHTGRAWFGAVGDSSHVELTALGDPVNTTARLAAAAQGGEIVVSGTAADAAGLDPNLPRTSLTLKGKEAPVEVVVLRA